MGTISSTPQGASFVTLINGSSPWLLPLLPHGWRKWSCRRRHGKHCLFSTFSLHVQTQDLAVCNPSSRGKPPRLPVSLQTLPVCSVIPELCQTHSISFNDLQLITSKCSLQSLLIQTARNVHMGKKFSWSHLELFQKEGHAQVLQMRIKMTEPQLLV